MTPSPRAKDYNNLNPMLDELFQYYREATATIVNTLAEGRINKSFTERSGDFSTSLDTDIFKHYSGLAQRHNFYFIAEEKRKGKDTARDLTTYDGVMILDSIDGTVNMLCGLPFGVNVAIAMGQKDKFSIDDIDLVFVAEYKQSDFPPTAYIWSRGSKPSVGKMNVGSEDHLRSLLHNRSLELKPGEFYSAEHLKSSQALPYFEIPDEMSYIPKGGEIGTERQLKLRKHFIQLFPKMKRLMVDCTGIRMLATYSKSLVAYGDVRGATKIWDTVPSIRFLLEAGFVVLDENYEPYRGGEFMVRQCGKGIEVNKNLGKNVIVLTSDDYERFKGLATTL